MKRVSAVVILLLLAAGGVLADNAEPVPLGEFPARLVAVYPGHGSTDAPAATSLKLRFDEPIDPRAFCLTFDRGGFVDSGEPALRAGGRDLIVPVSLLLTATHRVGFDDRFGRSLRGVDGLAVAAASWEFTTLEADSVPADAGDPDEAPATLRSIEPPAGSTVPRVTWVTARFDRAVDSGVVRLEIVATRSAEPERPSHQPRVEAAPLIQVADAGKAVSLPLVLPANWEGDVRVTIGRAKPFTVAYATTDELIDWNAPAFAPAPDNEADLRAVVERARNARRELSSAAVTASSRAMSAGPGQVQPFTRLRCSTGEFRFQGDRQYVGDVSGWMGSPFVIGSDGESCWFLSERRGGAGEKRLELTRCARDLIDDASVSIVDAFAAREVDVDRMIKSRRLSLVGSKALRDAECHVVRSWEARELGSADRVWVFITDWWVDSKSFLPRRVVRCFSGGSKQVTDLRYEQVNEAMPATAFEPPHADVATRVEVGPLGEGYKKRFLTISDGSNGRVTARWGKYGDRGRSSSGLN